MSATIAKEVITFDESIMFLYKNFQVCQRNWPTEKIDELIEICQPLLDNPEFLSTVYFYGRTRASIMATTLHELCVNRMNKLWLTNKDAEKYSERVKTLDTIRMKF